MSVHSVSLHSVSLHSGRSRMLLATTVLANIMQAIDITITNIALATIAGEMSATLHEAAWLLTAYVVGSAIGLPLTAFLNDRLGRRTLFVATVGGFTAASLLCGVSTSIEMLVAARFVQGFCAAAIAPIGNAVMAASYPKEMLPKVLSYFNMSMLVVPILGPSFGGFITEAFGWRWLFLMNVPLGLLIMASALHVMEQTPVQSRTMDFTGFLVLSTALVSMQLIIDHGNERGFDSAFVLACAFALGSAAVMLIVHYVSRPAAPIINLAPLRDRNFVIGLGAWIPFSIALWGGQLLQPFLFQQQFGHTPVETGVLLMPRAVGAFVTMYLYSRISKHVSASTFLCVGGAIATAACLWMTQMSPQMTGQWMILPLILQGMGLGLVVTPLTVLAYSTLPKELAAEASTMYYLVRTIGSATGIGVVSVYTTRGFDQYWAEMRGLIDLTGPAAGLYLAPLGISPDSAEGAMLLAATVAKQANMAAFIDGHWLAAAATAFLLPLAVLLRAKTPAAPAQPAKA